MFTAFKVEYYDASFYIMVIIHYNYQVVSVSGMTLKLSFEKNVI